MSGGGNKPPAASPAPAPQLPTIGRTVIHVRDGLARAAVITEVFDDSRVGLHVFRRYTEVDQRGENPVHIVAAEFSEQPADDCWSWPVRG